MPTGFWQQTNKADCSQFFIGRTTHSNTHVLNIYMEATRTHYTHAGLRSPCSFALSLTHPGSSFLQDPPGAVGSFSAPGDQVNCPSRSGTDRSVLFFLHVFLLGFLV